jgi:ribosomal protein S18 acetylase RimI-like enzyme
VASPTYSVRDAAAADADGVLRCLSAAFEPYRDQYSADAWRDTVLSAETIHDRLSSMSVLVAVTPAGEIVGTIASQVVSPEEGHLRGMAVLPAWQGAGVAGALLKAAERRLGAGRCARISLDTTAPLARAIRFYEHHGFCSSGRVRDFFGMPLFEYVKVLSDRCGIPLLSLAITPKTAADAEKFVVGLQTMMAEHRPFRVVTDPERGETVITVVDEEDLETIVDRLKRQFQVEARVGRPQVVCKETLTRPAEGVGRYVKHTGGRGQYGHAEVRVTPREPGAGVEFVNSITPGTIPREYITPIEEGVREALTAGVLAGYPIDDVSVELHGGSYHDLDSSEMAFRLAGALALRDAARKAHPVVLEPVMRVEVVVPDEHGQTVADELIGRRGHIESHDHGNGTRVISARVPFATMLGYAQTLRALSRGRGTCSMTLDRYEPVRADPGSDDDGPGLPAAVPRRPVPSGDRSAAVPEADENGP